MCASYGYIQQNYIQQWIHPTMDIFHPNIQQWICSRPSFIQFPVRIFFFWHASSSFWHASSLSFWHASLLPSRDWRTLIYCGPWTRLLNAFGLRNPTRENPTCEIQQWICCSFVQFPVKIFFFWYDLWCDQGWTYSNSRTHFLLIRIPWAIFLLLP